MSSNDDLEGGSQDQGPDDWVVGPPLSIAFGSLALGLLSVLVGIFDPSFRALQWLGWAVGFSAIIAGIAYRWVSRSRQTAVFYLPRYSVDRTMLAGVLAGFVGVVWNAYHLAQVVPT